MYNYPYYFQNMQQCNLNSSQFYRLQSQNVNCAQRINDGCTNVAFNLQQQRIEDTRERYKDFPKSCYNCKHKRYGYHNVTDGPCDMWGGLDSYDYARICIRSGYTFWEKFDEIEKDLEQVEKSISKTKQIISQIGSQENIRLEEQHAFDVCKSCKHNIWAPVNIHCMKFSDIFGAIKCREQGNKYYVPRTVPTHEVSAPKPEKKYTVYDMYDLVFPNDPIQAHFQGVYDRIEKECQEGIDFWDRVQVKPVECPVRALAESKEKPHTLEAVRDWLEFESYLVCGTAGAFPLVSTTVAVVFFFEGGLKDAAESVLLTGASFAAAFLVVSAVSFLRFLMWGSR